MSSRVVPRRIVSSGLKGRSLSRGSRGSGTRGARPSAGAGGGAGHALGFAGSPRLRHAFSRSARLRASSIPRMRHDGLSVPLVDGRLLGLRRMAPCSRWPRSRRRRRHRMRRGHGHPRSHMPAWSEISVASSSSTEMSNGMSISAPGRGPRRSSGGLPWPSIDVCRVEPLSSADAPDFVEGRSRGLLGRTRCGGPSAIRLRSIPLGPSVVFASARSGLRLGEGSRALCEPGKSAATVRPRARAATARGGSASPSDSDRRGCLRHRPHDDRLELRRRLRADLAERPRRPC